MTKYYPLGGTPVALRRGDAHHPENTDPQAGLAYLGSDYLGSVGLVTDGVGAPLSQSRYTPYGTVLEQSGLAPTDRGYTGQRNDDMGLLDYHARFYDPVLGRFISPDSIVPTNGEGNNPNSIGYLADANYSALVVDYHENQFLEQLNKENQARLQDPQVRLPSVPTNPLAFDRYAYTFNNPIRYNDPTGHCPWCVVVGVVVIAGAPVEITAGVVILTGGAIILLADQMLPGAQERNQVLIDATSNLAEQASQGLQALFAKREYIPPGLSEGERNAYREAVHRYKQGYGLGAADNVDKQILDKLAELVKKGFKPGDAADKAPAPLEKDDDYDREYGRGDR